MATQFEIDCALMAGASYISTRKEKNQFPLPDGWLPKKYENPQNGSGFEAISFVKGTELVISFAGTYDQDIAGDIAADVGLATGVGSIQLLQAVIIIGDRPRFIMLISRQILPLVPCPAAHAFPYQTRRCT